MKLRHGALVLSTLVCSGLVLAAYAQRKGGPFSSGQLSKSKGKVNSAELIRARANWFYQQRAYPLGHIPAFARARAWKDFRQMQQTQRQSFVQKFGTNYRQSMATLAVTAGAITVANTWKPIGPQPTNAYFYQPGVSGRVSALVVDPCDTSGNTVFLGGAQGGLWVGVGLSAPSSAKWIPLTDLAQSLAVGSIAVPPGTSGCISVNVGSTAASVPSKIYVGTGEENFSLDSYYGAGILTCSFSSGVTYSGSNSLPCTPDQTFGQYFAGNQTNQTNALNQYFAGPYIGGLAVDPQNSSIMLAAVWGSGSTLPSGIWCSADAGSKWTHVLPSGVTGEIGTAVGFDQAGYGYAAIGNLGGSGSLNGIYRTTTAYPVSPSSPNCAPSFSTPGTLASAAGGVSAMGRISFSVLSSSSAPSDPTKDEIFAAVANASDYSDSLNGVYKSVDGGNTWTSVTPATYNNVCGSQCFYDIPISIDPRNSNVVYVGGSAPPLPSSGQSVNPGPSASIIATTDGGSTWSDVANNFISVNGPHVDTHAFAFTPSGDTNDLLYVGNDGGVWSTTKPDVSPSASQSWSNLNTTLGLTQIYAGMSTNPSGWQYRTYLGSQDNGSQVLGSDLANPSGGALPPAAGPWAWNDTLFCGDGGFTLVDPLIPSTVYSSCAYIPGTSTSAAYFGIGKSVFNGHVNDGNTNPSTSYFSAGAGINSDDNGNFVPPFAIDPEQTGSTGDAQTLYFGTCRVWQSIDGGNSWSAISPDVTGGPSTSPICNSDATVGTLSGVLTSLAVAPTNSNEVVTGSFSGHVFVSENVDQGSNATWTDVTGTGALPQRSITQVAVDPSGPNTLYATFSGFSSCSGCDGKGHVYAGTLVSTSGVTSATWTDISSGTGCTSPAGNLPDIPVNAIIVDPNVAGQLFVGTDVGVYVGTLQGTAPAYTGACWQPLGAGLPNSAVLSLTLNNASRTLIAGTHGRSAWAYSLGDLPAFSLASLSPASANAGGSAFTMTLTGNGFTSGSSVNWTPQGGSATSLPQAATLPPGCAGPPACIAVSVPTSLTAAGGLASVSVSNSSTTTNSLTFSVTSLTPTITSISPTSSTPGSLNLSLTGANYNSSTTIGLTTEVAPLSCSPLTPNSGGTSTSIAASISSSCLQYGGLYFVSASNPMPGGGSSNPNNIAAPSPLGGGCGSSTPAGCLLAIKAPAPANDSFANATNISSNSYTTTEDTSGATYSSSDPGIPSNCTSVAGINDNGDYKSVWFKYTPTTYGTADINTIGSNYDTILSVWTGTASNLVPVTGGCNDDIAGGSSYLSQITNLALNANTTYYVLVSDWGVPVYDANGNLTSVAASGGKLVFNMAVSTTPAPTYTASVGSVSPSTVTAGSSATFTLTLNGSSSSTAGTITPQPCTTSPSTTTISCAYNPGTLSVGPSSSASTTVTISTTARGAVPPAIPFQSPPVDWIIAVFGMASMLAFLLMRRRAALGRAVTIRSRIAAALSFALLAGLLVFSAACGGGGSSSSSTTTGTAAGTYTITVPITPSPSNGNPTVQLTVQ